MKVGAVSPAGTSTAGAEMMAIWRMSMTQRCQHELQQRVSGREQKQEPRKIEPAVRVEISQQAREVAKKQQ